MSLWLHVALGATGLLYGYFAPWVAEHLTRRGGAHEHP